MKNGNSLIELARVDGNMVPFERHGNNVWVNLTEMGRPFGKHVNDWLRQKSTREYLLVARNMLVHEHSVSCHVVRNGNSRFGQSDSPVPEPIIIRKGGIPGEQGTWCTDYRIAMQFARWLSLEFAWLVDNLLQRIVNGERVLGDDGVLLLNGRRWIGEAVYCRLTGRTRNSFNGYYGNYPLAFVLYEGLRYMDLEFFHNREQKDRIEGFRRRFRAPKSDPLQGCLEFRDE